MTWTDKTLYWARGNNDDSAPPSTKRIVRVPIKKVRLAVGVVDTPGGYRRTSRDDFLYRTAPWYIRAAIAVVDVYWFMRVGKHTT